MSTAIQSVKVVRHTKQPEPSPHLVYEIEVRTPARTWRVHHRYSDFQSLHTDLTSAISPPPTSLPPKHAVVTCFTRSLSADQITERKEGLDKYLRDILSNKDTRWAESAPFRSFLQVKEGAGAGIGGAATFTPSSWSSEHQECLTIAQQVRSAVNRRDSLAAREDTSNDDVRAAGQEHREAWSKLQQLATRSSALTEGLGDLKKRGMVEAELRRRTDMASALGDEILTLNSLLKTRPLGLQTSAVRRSGPTAIPGNSTAAGSGSGPGLSTSPRHHPTGRVFGQPQKPPQETAETRGLSNVQVYARNEAIIEQQDADVSQLLVQIRSHKNLAQVISNELAEQDEIITGIEQDLDSVERGFDRTGAQFKKLNG